MVRRFVEEAQIGGQLQHPGHRPGPRAGPASPTAGPFIAMKLVRGRTLAALLRARRDPADDLPRFLAIFEQVCQAMAYAHAAGRDPPRPEAGQRHGRGFGEVQVMDWGLAKVLDRGGVADEARPLVGRDDGDAVRTVRTGSEAGDSQAGAVLGTPAYMAPSRPAARSTARRAGRRLRPGVDPLRDPHRGAGLRGPDRRGHLRPGDAGRPGRRRRDSMPATPTASWWLWPDPAWPRPRRIGRATRGWCWPG